MRGEQAMSVPAPAAARTLDGFMALVGPALNLHPVQAIAASECRANYMRTRRPLFAPSRARAGSERPGGAGGAGVGSRFASRSALEACGPPHLRPFFVILHYSTLLHAPRCARAASEAIAAGKLLTPPGSPAVPVLLHTRVSSATLELRCKTADAGLTAAILAGIAARLR
jgi:hypothetical protein